MNAFPFFGVTVSNGPSELTPAAVTRQVDPAEIEGVRHRGRRSARAATPSDLAQWSFGLAVISKWNRAAQESVLRNFG
jgi:hypothetical protein